MILAEFSVTASDWVDVFLLFAVIAALVGLVLAVVKAPVNLMIFVFLTLGLGFAGLLCQ